MPLLNLPKRLLTDLQSIVDFDSIPVEYLLAVISSCLLNLIHNIYAATRWGYICSYLSSE